MNKYTPRLSDEDIYIVNCEFDSSAHKLDDGDDDGANVTIIRVMPPSERPRVSVAVIIIPLTSDIIISVMTTQTNIINTLTPTHGITEEKCYTLYSLLYSPVSISYNTEDLCSTIIGKMNKTKRKKSKINSLFQFIKQNL